MIIIVLGLPGSGKTYFAKAFSDKLGIPHFNTDTVRKELNKRGDYCEANKQDVYKTLFNKVESMLLSNPHIIVDATFSKRKNRIPYLNLSEKSKVPLLFIEVIAQEDCIKERLKSPRPDSEADYEVYKKIKEEFEPLRMEHLKLPSDQLTIEEMISIAIDNMYLSS